MARQRIWRHGIGTLLLAPILATTVVAASPVNLSDTATDVTGIALAADATGLVHALWSDDGSLYHRINNGGDWSAAQHVAIGWQPDVSATASGGLDLVFVAQPDEQLDIMYASWDAAGGWTLPTNVSQSANSSASPSVAKSSGGDLAVAWSELGAGGSLIMWGESPDGGQWTTSPVPQAQGSSPQVVYGADDALTVVWEDVFDLGFPLEIMAATRGAEPGAEWSLPEDVSYSISEASTAPSCVSDGTVVWLAWEEIGPEGTTIMVSSLMEGEWSLASSVTASGDHSLPALAIDPTLHVHLAWLDGTNIQRLTMAEVSAHWNMADPLVTGAESVSALSLAVGDDAMAAWLSGQEGVDRDAFAGSWMDPAELGYHALLPLVVR